MFIYISVYVYVYSGKPGVYGRAGGVYEGSPSGVEY